MFFQLDARRELSAMRDARRTDQVDAWDASKFSRRRVMHVPSTSRPRLRTAYPPVSKSERWMSC